jgi:hypothetical protein
MAAPLSIPFAAIVRQPLGHSPAPSGLPNVNRQEAQRVEAVADILFRTQLPSS